TFGKGSLGWDRLMDNPPGERHPGMRTRETGRKRRCRCFQQPNSRQTAFLLDFPQCGQRLTFVVLHVSAGSHPAVQPWVLDQSKPPSRVWKAAEHEGPGCRVPGHTLVAYQIGVGLVGPLPGPHNATSLTSLL